MCRRSVRGARSHRLPQRHRHLGAELVCGFHPWTLQRPFAEPRRPALPLPQGRDPVHQRSARHLGLGPSPRWRDLRRYRTSRPPVQDRRSRQEHAAVDRGRAREFRPRRGSLRCALRRHLARWQGLPHREWQGHRILRAQGTLHLVAGRGPRWRPLRGHRSAGHGEVWYETGQSHITGLAVDTQNRVLAGTEPNGILYRITAKDKAFVLYDASLPEIRAIVPMPDGTVYAAALGGSTTKRAQAANQAAQGNSGSGAAVTSSVTTITVEAQAAEIKPPDPTKPAPTTPGPAASTPQVSTQFTPVVDVSGVEKSAVYRIN